MYIITQQGYFYLKSNSIFRAELSQAFGVLIGMEFALIDMRYHAGILHQIGKVVFLTDKDTVRLQI